jgi:large subunit ribosomal protein L18
MKALKRRRKENKTDYLKRLKLLKSDKPRIVFRKTNKYIIAQYVLSIEAQDKVSFGVTSKELIKYGWPESAVGGLKSVTATYLTGYLIGKRIIKNKLAEPIIDFGMIPVLHKSKVFAFLKGVIDSGIKINCKKETFPEEARIKGEHLKNKIKFEDIKSKINKE